MVCTIKGTSWLVCEGFKWCRDPSQPNTCECGHAKRCHDEVPTHGKKDDGPDFEMQEFSHHYRRGKANAEHRRKAAIIADLETEAHDLDD